MIQSIILITSLLFPVTEFSHYQYINVKNNEYSIEAHIKSCNGILRYSSLHFYAGNTPIKVDININYRLDKQTDLCSFSYYYQ